MSKKLLTKKSRGYLITEAKFIVLCVVVLAFLILISCSLFKVFEIDDTIVGIICTFFGVVLSMLGNVITELKDAAPWESHLSYIVKRDKLPQDTKIRISYAAFVVVEVDGLYLLLKNRHGINLFQMPSSTYPIENDEEVIKIKTNFGAVADDFIKKNYSDFRFLVPLTKIKKFYKHFCEYINPYEYSYQSIVDFMVDRTGLNGELFANSNIMFEKRLIKKIEFSRYTGHYEMIVHDVCHLLLTDEQKSALRGLKNSCNEKFKFATYDEIKANGISKEKGNLYADIATITFDLLEEHGIQ